MKYSIEKNDKFSLFQLHEENLNALIAPKLKSEFIFLWNEGVESLVLDMGDVKFVDSSGLSAILTANRLWKDNGSFIITGVKNDGVKKLIEISRLETILNIKSTTEEALDFINSSATGSEEEEA